MKQLRPDHIYAKEYLVACGSYRTNPHLSLAAARSSGFGIDPRRRKLVEEFMISESDVSYYYKDPPKLSLKTLTDLLNKDLQQLYYLKHKDRAAIYENECYELFDAVDKKLDLVSVLEHQTEPRKPKYVEIENKASHGRRYVDGQKGTEGTIKAPPEPDVTIGPNMPISVMGRGY